MYLNTISPASRKERTRVGRGPGSGKGKTCGAGQKGQKSRSGYSAKSGFEGGQMPLQRRLPKYGFNSWKKGVTAEIRLSTLEALATDHVDMDVLRKANVINANTRFAKVIANGEIKKKVTLVGIKASAGARAAIEAAGGKIEE